MIVIAIATSRLQELAGDPELAFVVRFAAAADGCYPIAVIVSAAVEPATRLARGSTAARATDGARAVGSHSANTITIYPRSNSLS
jgi:hypothetical protein